MKIAKRSLAVLSLLTCASLAQAAVPGTYVGMGLGASRQDTPNEYLLSGSDAYGVSQSRQRGGLGGRLFMGYNFNRYFGVEAGLAKYANSKYKATDGFNTANLKYETAALDLVGKAYLPLAESGMSLYGLGGAAVVRSKATYSGEVYGYDYSESKTKTQVRPIAGLGASYDIPNTQLTTAVEYSHIFGKTNGDLVPSADLVTLNLAVNFG